MSEQSPSTDKFAPFRGALRAAVGAGEVLWFVTVHPEGLPTALYRLDVDKAELEPHALPGGATAVVADDASVYVAGTDGFVHKAAIKTGKLAALGPKLAPAPTALALLDGGRLAVVAGSEVVIVDRKTGAARQRFPLPDEGTAIASDASGKWLVAGTARGVVAVFEAEDRSDIHAGDARKLHEGAVSALAFDPDELRVYSSGSDNKLLLTHVRGALEPEDRTGGGGHEGLPTAIVIGAEDKLYTAARDGTIKTWTRGPQKRRPATQKDGVVAAAGLARVEHKGRPHLALLGDDATLRLFALDVGGKVGDRVLTFHDAYAQAENELRQSEPARRQKALEALAGYDDARAIAILAAQAAADAGSHPQGPGGDPPRQHEERARSKAAGGPARRPRGAGAPGRARRPARAGGRGVAPPAGAGARQAEAGPRDGGGRGAGGARRAGRAGHGADRGRARRRARRGARRGGGRAGGDLSIGGPARRRPASTRASPRSDPGGPTSGASPSCASSSASSSASRRRRPRSAATRATPTPTSAAPRSWSR